MCGCLCSVISYNIENNIRNLVLSEENVLIWGIKQSNEHAEVYKLFLKE